MPILCRKNAEKATGKTGCGKRIGMARLRACMMYRVSVRMDRPVASAAAIPAQPAGREENVAAVTAQPLAALPPYGCGVPFTGGERHAGCRFGGTPPTAPDLVGERRRCAPPPAPADHSWKVSYRFRPFCLSKSPAAAGDQTRKDTLTVSFHTFLSPEAFGLVGFLTVCFFFRVFR